MNRGHSIVTTDHEIIQRWAEKRGGKPAIVKTGETNGGSILRIDFPGYSGKETLEHTTWEKFFIIFDDRNLQFLYQDKTMDGKESRFFKFVRQSNDE